MTYFDQRDNNMYQEFFNYDCMDHEKLELIDREIIKDAFPGARNEAPLLKSVFEHPDAYIAQGITGLRHQVICVYDTIVGSKTTQVEPVAKLVNCITNTRDPGNIKDGDKENDKVSNIYNLIYNVPYVYNLSIMLKSPL